MAGDLGQQATRELVHGVGSHRAQLITMTLSSKFRCPSGWKRYPWRRISEEEKMKVIASMELFWHWALVGGATPDNFLGAYHHVADELIYRDSQKLRTKFLDALMKAGDTANFVSSKVVEAAARAEIREQDFGEVVSDKEMAGVTSAMKSHLRISSAALTLFGAIKGHEEDIFIDVEEALREI